MTPQEQRNRLNDIMFHAQRCELYDDEHRLYAKMGLGITIYFYGGGSESGQRKVLEVFKKYQEQYSKYLNDLSNSVLRNLKKVWRKAKKQPNGMKD